MPLNTVTVGAAITPTVTKTWLSHYLNRKPLHQKPTAHISYDLGLHLVRRFVEYSALHTVEELQAFTAQWVPVPHWVKSEDVEISQTDITKAAEYLQANLGPEGIEQVGGKEWWQWRREKQPLKAEWIEMRSDYNERKEKNEKSHRVMLYVHGGAYYFGSVDEHRYQIQRHARKLKARCLAPRYRLAPQFPFPCGLHDCISAYLYLLNEYDHTEIIVAGDSAGGGMVLAMLVVLRDQGVPLPAGGILISPWVDLMHSFPSLCGDGMLDYIPSDGFIHKPSMGWPPPTLEDVKDDVMPTGVAAGRTHIEDAPGLTAEDANKEDLEVPARDKKRGFSITDPNDVVPNTSAPLQEELKMASKSYRCNMTGRLESAGHVPSVMVDGKLVQIRDQIQMYAPNHLLTNPLVSPILQPSLGGLPPLLIQVGGGEMLRDEQLYLAHKAANPAMYPPREEIMARHDPERVMLNKYKPTDVQVQLWEDMCHVGHTLSWTRPAKFMYRSVAQFGAWALAHAQQRPIDIPDYESSDTDSESTGSEDEGSSKKSGKKSKDSAANGVPAIVTPKAGKVGKAGDPLPPFENHMIRQRVDRHGDIWDLTAPEEIAALQLDPEEIGKLKEGPVKKWLHRQEKWNKKFAATKRELQKKRALQLDKGYVGLPEGEKPPPTAQAGMRITDLPKLKKITKSYGMTMWSGWGSKHDQMRLHQDQEPDSKAEAEKPKSAAGEKENLKPPSRKERSRSRSRSRSVIDEGQANGSTSKDAVPPLPTPSPATEKKDPLLASAANGVATNDAATDNGAEAPPGATVIGNTLIPESHTTSTRPTADGIAYPFKLKVPEEDVRSTNASMMTLDSEDVMSVRSKAGVLGGENGRLSTSTEKAAGASSPLATPLATPMATPGMTPGLNGERPPFERFETAQTTL